MAWSFQKVLAALRERGQLNKPAGIAGKVKDVVTNRNQPSSFGGRIVNALKNPKSKGLIRKVMLRTNEEGE